MLRHRPPSPASGDSPPRRSPRRTLPVALLLALTAPALLVSCAQDDAPAAGGAKLAKTKIPAKVSPRTTLTIGAPEDHVLLKLSGEIRKLPFRVKWANISGGPQCSEAFRAHSLDLCSSAEVPSIHAHWTGLDTKLVAAEFRKDPRRNPITGWESHPARTSTPSRTSAARRSPTAPGRRRALSCCAFWTRRA